MLTVAHSATVVFGPWGRERLRRPQAGFTIPELMIALLVLGVLTAVALPSFIDSIRKGRRSEAFAAIAAVQQAQEQWRSNKAAYTDTMSELKLPSDTKYYDLTVSEPSALGYTVTAVGKEGTSQANDGQCRKLSVLVEKGSVKYAGCSGSGTCTYTAENTCWKQ